MLKQIKASDLQAIAQEGYEKVKGIQDGANANYIPYLANIDSSLFGVTICLPSGKLISIGDTKFEFGIESISKVHTAILVMKQLGADAVLERIGANATGMPFNSIMAILLENDHPSTPLVNAGAIAANSLVEPIGDSSSKWKAIEANMNELSGGTLSLISELYKSESETNYNNRSIAWLLKNFKRIYDSPDIALDLYTRQCSMGVTCEQLATTAATIAMDGYNPVTKHQVFDKSLSPHITSLVATVGFYENTGDWLYTSGIPAKSGVGGGIMGIVPGSFGIAAFSPPLDKAGNSVRAQEVIKYLTKKIGANIFGGNHIEVVE